MSFRLFHTGKNTSFFPLYYFPRVLHGLLTDLATLSHHHCQVTIGAQAQKRELTLLFKNRFVVPPYHGQFLKLKKSPEFLWNLCYFQRIMYYLYATKNLQ